MNLIDLADIHAAAMGIAEGEGPDVLRLATVAGSPPDLPAILRENQVRKRRIRKAMMSRRAQLQRLKVQFTTA